MTNRSMPRLLALLWAAAALLITTPAAAQHGGHAHGSAALPTSGLRAELIQDLDQLERKYLGLAEAMAGKYTWRPADGVRSAGEVFMHVANANLMISTMAGAQLPEAFRGATMQEARAKLQARENTTDSAVIRDALQQSFAHVRHTIATVPDDELDAAVKLFGQDATKRRVLSLLLTHMHEHLGQAIAYARVNGVTPPWSAEN